jgi:hypothetical protein
MVRLHGFYWNRDDGNHRIVVAKRLGYPRMRVQLFQTRLKPNVSTNVRSRIDRVEHWATGRQDGSVALETPPPRSPAIPVFRLPKDVKLVRARVVVVGPDEPTFDDGHQSPPQSSHVKGHVNRNPRV